MEKQNKVEKSQIDAMVASLEFKFVQVEGTTITGCWAILPNGWKAGYGESSCVVPEEFNKEDGEKYAKERAIQAATNKLWENEGYLLKMTGQTSYRSGVLVAPVVLEMVISDFDEFQGLTQSLLDNYSDLPAPVLEALDGFVNKSKVAGDE